MSLFYHFSSDEMIDSTSTLVRTESVKSQQSSVTMASNDSVSELRFVSQLSPDDIAVIIIIIIIIISSSSSSSSSSLSSSSSSIYIRECIRPSVSITTLYRTGSLALSPESSPNLWPNLWVEGIILHLLLLFDHFCMASSNRGSRVQAS